MDEPRLLRLRMRPDLPLAAQRRIAYAFRLFCSVYGYHPVLEDDEPQATQHPRICYGTEPVDSYDIALPALYLSRPPSASADAPVQKTLRSASVYRKLGLESIPCFHTSDDAVDWLGEIFEWVSCADEYAVTQRDGAGRIPFEAGIHGRFDLDPAIPYAGIAMYELNHRIRELVGTAWPERAATPGGMDCVLVASSHDLDYLPLNASSDIKRILKNMAIAAIHYRDPRLAFSIGVSLARGIVNRESPLDCIDAMLAGEVDAGIHSTYLMICHRAHARDANYEIENPKVRRALQQFADKSMEIALHGSYTSLEDRGLKPELERLAAVGYRAVGVRQHWLRFAGDNLFEEVAKLKLSYDSTVGFSGRVGFRAGACFPYFPYDFKREQAYPFVEIPLALMDVALYEQSRRAGSSAGATCRRVLDMVESFGWGGVAILWHNTGFRGAQVPLDIGRLYWELKRPSHKWVSCVEVAQVAQMRLQSAFAVESSDGFGRR